MEGALGQRQRVGRPLTAQPGETLTPQRHARWPPPGPLLTVLAGEVVEGAVGQQQRVGRGTWQRHAGGRVEGRLQHLPAVGTVVRRLWVGMKSVASNEVCND